MATHTEARGASREIAYRTGVLLRSLPALGLFVALGSWPAMALSPTPGLDASWGAGLHMALHQGLVFGSQIVFTYGPLGFLDVPTLWFQDSGVIAFAYSAFVHVLACTLIVWTASRFLNRVLAVAIAVVACSFLGPPLVVIALLVTTGGLRGEIDPRAERVLAALMGALAAFAFLVKLNFGVEILAIGVLWSVASPWRVAWRRLAEVAAAFASSLALLWVLLGQPLTALPDYTSLSVAVISGHSQAMALADPGSHFEVFLAVVLVIGSAATAWSLGGELERRRRVVLTAVIAVFGFFAFKEGFVRQDDGHVGLFASGIVSAWFALGWKPRLGWQGVVSFGVLIAIATYFQPAAIDPIQRIDGARQQLTTILRAENRYAASDEGRATILASAAIDPSIVKALRGHTVHVSPYETSVAWALDLDWKPLPVFQEYLAYTSSLDKQNADAIESGEAPELILRRHEEASIDSHYPAYDGPAAAVATLCRYKPQVVRAAWMVLRRGPDRCGSKRFLGSLASEFGKRIAVPSASPGHIVIARVRGVGVTGLERIRASLFRARPRYIRLIDPGATRGSQTYRLIPGTAEDGLLMSAPPGTDYPAPFTMAPDASAFVVGGSGLSGPIDVEFLSLPIAAND